MIVTSAPNKHRKGDCNCDMQLEQKGKPARSVHNLCNTLRWSRNGYRGLESYTCFHRRLKVQQPSANWHAHNLLKSEKNARSMHNLCNTFRWSRNGSRALESYTCFHQRLKVQQPNADWHARNSLNAQRSSSTLHAVVHFLNGDSAIFHVPLLVANLLNEVRLWFNHDETPSETDQSF